MARVCRCGRIYKPSHARQYRCPICEPAHRRSTNRRAYDRRKHLGLRRGSLPRAKRDRIIERDGGICQVQLVCDGAPADTVDHIRPRIHGGTDDDDNLRASCGPCNASKGAR